MGRKYQTHSLLPKELHPSPSGGHPYAAPQNLAENCSSANDPGSSSWDSLNDDFQFDSDIFLQLDAFPFRTYLDV